MAAHKRHTGELYDAIWRAALPRIRGVDHATVRLVLMAMAKFTNPNRDHGLYRCWASVATLAHLAVVSERSVQRILTGLWHLHFLDVEQVGQRAGRNRAPTPTRYVLMPERWPARCLNGGDAGVAAMMVVTPASDGGDVQGATNAMVATPGANGGDAGVTRTRNRTRNKTEPVNEPAAAAAFPPTDSSNTDDDETPRSRCERCGEFYVTATMHERRCTALAAPDDIVHCPTCPGGGRNMTRATLRTHQCRGKQVAS